MYMELTGIKIIWKEGLDHVSSVQADVIKSPACSLESDLLMFKLIRQNRQCNLPACVKHKIDGIITRSNQRSLT